MASVTDAGAPAPAKRVDLLLLAALFAIAVATYPYAALIVDSGRDLAWGLSIARGEAFPLYGPSLNGLWQLGPAWYYLLALPLLASGSIGATAAFVGALAACKIPLAYRVGASRGGAGLGLAFAAMIALPGWGTLGQLVLSHTSLTELGVLGTLALSLRSLERRSAASGAAAACVLGLAVHAHPTALVAAPAVALALFRTERGERRWILVAALAFVAPFLPAVFAEASAGWPQWRNSTGYFGSADYPGRLARFPAVIHGLSIGQWQFVQDFLLTRTPFSGRLLGTLWLVVVALSVIGLFRHGGRRRATAALVGLMLWSWLFVLLLRDQTPAWMIYAWSPIACALLASGWQALWGAGRSAIAARCLAAFAVLASGGVLLDRIGVARDGVQYLPGAAVADVASPVHRDLPVRFWFPAWAHDPALVALCRGPAGTTLHGELAAAIGFAQGVAFALHCPATLDLRLAGRGAAPVAGIPRAIAERLGLRGNSISGGYVVLSPSRVIAPREGERVALHRRYRVDDFRAATAPVEATTLQIREACTQDDILAVTNLMPGLNAPFQVANPGSGETPRRVAQTITTHYFACPGAGGFRLDVASRDPLYADVVVLRSGSD